MKLLVGFVITAIGALFGKQKHFDYQHFTKYEGMNACELKVVHLKSNNVKLKAFYDSRHGEVLCPTVKPSYGTLAGDTVSPYVSKWFGPDTAHTVTTFVHDTVDQYFPPAETPAPVPFEGTRSTYWEWYWTEHVSEHWIPDSKAMYLRTYYFLSGKERVHTTAATPPEQEIDDGDSLLARSIKWLPTIDVEYDTLLARSIELLPNIDVSPVLERSTKWVCALEFSPIKDAAVEQLSVLKSWMTQQYDKIIAKLTTTTTTTTNVMPDDDNVADGTNETGEPMSATTTSSSMTTTMETTTTKTTTKKFDFPSPAAVDAEEESTATEPPMSVEEIVCTIMAANGRRCKSIPDFDFGSYSRSSRSQQQQQAGGGEVLPDEEELGSGPRGRRVPGEGNQARHTKDSESYYDGEVVGTVRQDDATALLLIKQGTLVGTFIVAIALLRKGIILYEQLG